MGKLEGSSTHDVSWSAGGFRLRPFADSALGLHAAVLGQSVDTSVVAAYDKNVSSDASQNKSRSNAQDSSYGACNHTPIKTSCFKKTPSPTFDGKRKLWPEFRAVWRRYAEVE